MIILGPVEIGENAVIGAGAIVTHSVSANMVFNNKKQFCSNSSLFLKEKVTHFLEESEQHEI